MNLKLILLSVIVLFSAACSSGQKENKTDNSSIFAETSPSVNHEEKIVDVADMGSVKLDLKDGKGSILIRKKERDMVSVEFMAEGYKKLKAHVSSPDTLANIRISQIIMPDGNIVVPFDMDMEYNLPINGKYKLSLHENTMAGDPWAGVFRVDVSLSE